MSSLHSCILCGGYSFTLAGGVAGWYGGAVRRGTAVLLVVVWGAAVVLTVLLWKRSYQRWDHWSTVREVVTPPGTAAVRQRAVVLVSHAGSLTLTRAVFDSRTGSYGLLPGAAAALPYSSVAAGLGLVPVVVLFRKVRSGRLRAAGTCPTCGYDIRASPVRCPECGTTVGV